MVPLYAARVQDLGPDDVAVFKCGACGHTAELWPSLLIGGLGLQPTDKVLDLERGLVCRLCLARGQAVVSIKWKATAAGATRRPRKRPRANGAVRAADSARCVSLRQDFARSNPAG